MRIVTHLPLLCDQVAIKSEAIPLMEVMVAALAMGAPCLEYSEECILLPLLRKWIKVVSVVTSVCFAKRIEYEFDSLEGL